MACGTLARPAGVTSCTRSTTGTFDNPLALMSSRQRFLIDWGQDGRMQRQGAPGGRKGTYLLWIKQRTMHVRQQISAQIRERARNTPPSTHSPPASRGAAGSAGPARRTPQASTGALREGPCPPLTAPLSALVIKKRGGLRWTVSARFKAGKITEYYGSFATASQWEHNRR